MRNRTMARKSRRRADEGYVLLYLMFAVALLALSFVTLLPDMAKQRKRDQEEELIHRGVQYSRAIRRYFRRNGGYPTSVDALVSSNNTHYLRKAYKDPITQKDFKILHRADVKLSFGQPIGNSIAGAQTLGQPIGANGNINGTTPDPNATSGTQQSAGTNPNPNANANGTDPSQSADSSSSSAFVTASGQPAGNTFGGGPLLGVASVSTDESIRVFDKKNHYNDWQFIYDPSTDRGALIVGPYQPVPTLLQGQNGQPVNLNGYGQGMGGGQGLIPGGVTPGTVNPRPH